MVALVSYSTKYPPCHGSQTLLIPRTNPCRGGLLNGRTQEEQDASCLEGSPFSPSSWFVNLPNRKKRGEGVSCNQSGSEFRIPRERLKLFFGAGGPISKIFGLGGGGAEYGGRKKEERKRKKMEAGGEEEEKRESSGLY